MKRDVGLRYVPAASMLALLSACGGGGEEDDAEEFEFDGYFTGTITPDGAAAASGWLYVAQDGKFYLSAAPRALFAGSGDSQGTSYSATGTGISSGFANGGTSASFSFSGTIGGQGGSLTGAYSGGGESGTYTFQWNSAVSSRPASLAAIAGSYRFPATGTALYTYVISSTGSFTMAATQGCTLSGQVRVLDAQWNYYSFQATPTACTGIPGAIEGHAWMLTADSVQLAGVQSGLPIFLPGTRATP